VTILGTVIALHEPTGKVSVDQMKLIRKNMFTVFRSLSQSPKAQDEAKNSYDLNSGLEEMPFRRIHTKGDKREDVCLKVLCTLYPSANKVDK
jgi:hypothetical protein